MNVTKSDLLEKYKVAHKSLYLFKMKYPFFNKLNLFFFLNYKI